METEKESSKESTVAVRSSAAIKGMLHHTKGCIADFTPSFAILIMEQMMSRRDPLQLKFQTVLSLWHQI